MFKVLSSREEDKKTQKLSPCANMAGKHGGVPIPLNITFYFILE